MDYLLAAHIQVTGGTEAAMQINQVVTQINNFGSAAKAANTGGLATDMDKAAQSSSGLHAALGRVGDALIRMGTYQGIRLIEEGFRQAINGVLDFDQAMTESLAIQSGVTSQMRGQMEDMAESIAIKFGEAPNKVAEGFYFMASAGLSAEQQIATLPQVMAFAKAGMMDLESATEMLFDALSAIGQKSDDPQVLAHNLTNLSDVLTEAAIKSQATVEQMGAALANKAGASIKAFNIGLNESVGVLEVFADQGIKGQTAGERFSMLIRDMALKSQKFSDEWKRMGVEVFDSQGNFNSLVTIFQQLDAALLPMSGQERIDALKSMGFTLRDISTVMSVLGTSGNLKAFVDDLDHAGGVAQRVAENQMESLRSKLAQLKSVSLVFAIEGFEKLEEAAAWLVATFTPAVNAVVDVLGHLVSGAAPVAAAFGGLVATAVVTGLQGIAAAVELVFSTIADHPGIVQGLGAALAGIAAVQIVGGIISIATAIGETLYLKALMAQDAINGLIVKIMNIAATEGAIAAVKAGFSGLVSLLTSPIAIGVGIGLGILALHKGLQDANDKAKEFRESLNQKYDTSTLLGMNLALIELENEMDRVTNKHKGNFFASIFDVFEIKAAENSLKDGNRELANMTIGLQLIANAATGASLPLGYWGDKLKEAGLNIKDFDIADLRGKISSFGVDMRAAGGSTEDVSKLLQQLARDAGIDIHAPTEEWVPKLAETYANFTKVRDITHEMGGVAEGSSAGMSSMEKAITVLGDEAATAEDKLSALKTVMDGLSGGQQNIFDQTTQFSGALADLGESMAKALPSFSSMTEEGRKQRDALSGAATTARDLALAHAQGTGNMQAGAEQLRNYAGSIEGVLRSAGLAEPVIKDLLFQMGLTPEQIDTLFKITTTPGEPAATNQALDETAKERDAKIKATPTNIDPANVDLAAVADAERIADIYANPTNTVPTGATLDNTAMPGGKPRESEAHQYGTNWPTVDDVFNRTARRRDSEAQQYATGHGSVDYWFNTAARFRSSQADQYANTAQAENDLNRTARNRTSTITVYTTSGNVYAGPTGFGIAEGGIVHAYAKGGFENHVAQIGKMGAARLWNEPETGGEAYIPLAMAKRTRSLAIWEETGKMLGAQAATHNISLSAPISVSVNGSGDPEATGRAVASQVTAGVDAALRRVLVELRSN